MRLVLATDSFAEVGGSETYLLTVAEQLQRLGHDVVVHTRETGRFTRLATSRGVLVGTTPRRLPGGCEGLITQDCGMAYEMAARFPHVPHLFVAHSWTFDFQLPPQVAGVIDGVVVMSERMRRRVQALAHAPRVIRLAQPIDVQHFRPLGAIADQPRRALLLGNYLHGTRRDALVGAWTAAGVECVVAGRFGEVAIDPARQLGQCEIVVGRGRSLLEGMASGRAAYIYDATGGDGWVTPESYEHLEADNFGGNAYGEPRGRERLTSDLDAYAPSMGTVNRDLVFHHHNAAHHAERLVAELRDPAPRHGPPGRTRELARMARSIRRVEQRAYALGTTSAILLEEVDALCRERDELLRLQASDLPGDAERLRRAAAARLAEIGERPPQRPAARLAGTRRYRGALRATGWLAWGRRGWRTSRGGRPP